MIRIILWLCSLLLLVAGLAVLVVLTTTGPLLVRAIESQAALFGIPDLKVEEVQPAWGRIHITRITSLFGEAEDISVHFSLADLLARQVRDVSVGRLEVNLALPFIDLNWQADDAAPLDPEALETLLADWIRTGQPQLRDLLVQLPLDMQDWLPIDSLHVRQGRVQIQAGAHLDWQLGGLTLHREGALVLTSPGGLSLTSGTQKLQFTGISASLDRLLQIDLQRVNWQDQTLRLSLDFTAGLVADTQSARLHLESADATGLMQLMPFDASLLPNDYRPASAGFYTEITEGDWQAALLMKTQAQAENYLFLSQKKGESDVRMTLAQDLPEGWQSLRLNGRLIPDEAEGLLLEVAHLSLALPLFAAMDGLDMEATRFELREQFSLRPFFLGILALPARAELELSYSGHKAVLDWQGMIGIHPDHALIEGEICLHGTDWKEAGLVIETVRLCAEGGVQVWRNQLAAALDMTLKLVTDHGALEITSAHPAGLNLAYADSALHLALAECTPMQVTLTQPDLHLHNAPCLRGIGADGEVLRWSVESAPALSLGLRQINIDSALEDYPVQLRDIGLDLRGTLGDEILSLSSGTIAGGEEWGGIKPGPLQLSGTASRQQVTLGVGERAGFMAGSLLSLVFVPDDLSSLEITVQPLDLARNTALLRRQFEGLGTVLVGLHGQISAMLRPLPEASGRITLDSVGFEAFGGQIAGLSGDMLLQAEEGKIVAPEIRINRLQFGFPLSQLRLSFSATPEKIDISRFEGDFMGGRMVTEAMQYHLSTGQGQGQIHLHEMSLGMFLQNLDVAGLTGTGLVSGTLPLRLTEEGLWITQGKLEAIEPGRLHYDPASGALPGQAEMISQILSDFRYHQLSITFDGLIRWQGAAEQSAMLRIRGHNPNYENGREIALNISLSGVLDALLRSGFGQSDLSRFSAPTP